MVAPTNPISEISRIRPVAGEGTHPKGPMKKEPEGIRQTGNVSLRDVDLEEIIEEVNGIVFGDHDRFEFRIHEGTGRMMVKLVDNETDEVIREIPPEKMLNLIANIWEMVGILVDERG